ncbi:hypothetical protein SS50377_25215 [Spironucleus salmonicida]|uniref:SF-assemblin n=1 Tax=Spironucleus salmonicida TaxID=348837 RepID=V6LLY8_9EUKA|nr:hypothetical protein SS50377_25215 [Spironucleus salmonicida]|eukprot:EST44726.1 hypothetical protein SS50377_15379 [Spironucleus salmonicida]
MSALAPNSPSQLKIKNMQETLTNFNGTRQDDPQTIARINVLSEKIHKSSTSDASKFQLLNDQLTKLQQAHSAEKASRELTDKRKTKEIELVEAGFIESIQNEQSVRTEVVRRLTTQIENMSEVSSQDLHVVSNQRESTNEQNLKFMRENITKVVETISSDREHADKEISRLHSELDSIVQEIRDGVYNEAQERENQQVYFQETFAKVCQMLQNKLSAERGDREKTEEELVNLLEQVCDRMH